jgi:hypothetical protein
VNAADLGAGHARGPLDPFAGGGPLRRRRLAAKNPLVEPGKLPPIAGNYICVPVFRVYRTVS